MEIYQVEEDHKSTSLIEAGNEQTPMVSTKATALERNQRTCTKTALQAKSHVKPPRALISSTSLKIYSISSIILSFLSLILSIIAIAIAIRAQNADNSNVNEPFRSGGGIGNTPQAQNVSALFESISFLNETQIRILSDLHKAEYTLIAFNQTISNLYENYLYLERIRSDHLKQFNDVSDAVDIVSDDVSSLQHIQSVLQIQLSHVNDNILNISERIANIKPLVCDHGAIITNVSALAFDMSNMSHALKDTNEILDHLHSNLTEDILAIQNDLDTISHILALIQAVQSNHSVHVNELSNALESVVNETKPLFDVSTMSDGFPDAIICEVSGIQTIFYVWQIDYGSFTFYSDGDVRVTNDARGHYAVFDIHGEAVEMSPYCKGVNITQLYAQHKAFNFVVSANV